MAKLQALKRKHGAAHRRREMNPPITSFVRSFLNWAFADSKSKSDSNFRVLDFEFFTSNWPLLQFLDLRLPAQEHRQARARTHTKKQTPKQKHLLLFGTMIWLNRANNRDSSMLGYLVFAFVFYSQCFGFVFCLHLAGMRFDLEEKHLIYLNVTRDGDSDEWALSLQKKIKKYLK